MPIKAKPLPSLGLIREFLEYDPVTGHLHWLKNPKRGKSLVGQRAGSDDGRGYWRVQLAGRMLLVHRVAWALYYGGEPPENLDHTNRDPSDNRICNLRESSYSENMCNRGAAKSNTTGFKGVTRRREKFRASIGINRRYLHLGTFDTAEAAHKAYQSAAEQLHKEFASF